MIVYRLRYCLVKYLRLVNNTSMRWKLSDVLCVGIGTVLVLFAAPYAYAETLQSSNFKIDESSVGTSGPLNATSATYGITDATGDIGVGNAQSSNYQVNAGSKTTGDPALSFSVSSSANFGTLTATQARTATATFSVINYTTYGYVVQIFGAPPTNDGHTLTAMSTLGTSVPGSEQFGINLVANTSPTSFGSNPDNGQFGYGSVGSNYVTSNQFYYQDGDIIAQASHDSGLTNYTLSYLVNVASLTPGGTYTTNQTLVVTGTY